MAKRVGEFHAAHRRDVFAFDTRGESLFEFAGRKVSFENDRTDTTNQKLIVRYGDDVLRLHVTIPGVQQLPGLVPHNDWLRVMRFGLMSGRTMEEFKRDLGNSPDLPDRLAIVTKTPLPGSDPASYGEIMMKHWTFDFYEFLPEGGFRTEKLRYPTHKIGQPLKDGELKDNTWQYQAALQLMSQQAREKLVGKYDTDAMSKLGWTLPLATVCGSVCIFALGFSFAPPRRKT